MKARSLLLVLLVGATPLVLPTMTASSPVECTPIICVPDCPVSVLCKPNLPDKPTLPGATACRDGVTEFTFFLNTGVDAAGNALPTGGVDPVWRVGPASPNGPAFAKANGNVPSAWWTTTGAQWINAYPGTQISGPLSDFVYGAAFAVPANAYGVTVSGQYAVDNSGVLTMPPATGAFPSPLNGFSSPTPFSWSGVAPGAYLLRADVHNRPASWGADTPTGLIVQAEVHGYCKPSGPILGLTACKDGARSFTIVLNTGLDAQGNLLGNNSMDAHWTSPFPSPSATYAHVPQYPGWLTPTASRWINVNPSGYGDSSAPVTRTYQVNYYLPPNAVNVVLSGQFAADNEGIMADTSVFQSTWLGATAAGTGFKNWTPVYQPITDLGYHSVTILATDYGVAAGVVAELHVTGHCKYPYDGLPVEEVLRRVA